MADKVDDKPAAKQEQHEDSHANLHDGEQSKAEVPNKPESTEQSKDANSSLADKLHSGELSTSDWRKLGKFNDTNGAEAKSILSLNPLGDQIENTLERGVKGATALLDRAFKFDFTCGSFGDYLNYGKDATHVFGDKLKGAFTNPFDSGRRVNSLDEMGMRVKDISGSGVYTPGQVDLFNLGSGAGKFNWGNGNWNSWRNHDPLNGLSIRGETILDKSNLSFEDGKLDFAKSMTSTFWSESLKDLPKQEEVSRVSDEQKGGKSLFDRLVDGAVDIGGKLVDGAVDAGKSLWNKATELGSEILDSSKKLGNATVEFISEGVRKETRETPGGKVETTIGPDGKTFKVSGDTITQSKVNADGVHEHTKIESGDGRALSQDNGVRTLSNDKRDILVQHDPKKGKFEVFDKSGKEIAEFNTEGDAKRFFENAITEVVKPGENLDDAYNRFLKENPDKVKDGRLSKPILLMDGKGETLTVQPDGSTLRTHANGDTEAILKHIGRDGKPREIEVKVHDGQVTVARKGGRHVRPDSQEAKDLVQDSRVKIDEQGQIQVNQDTSGDPYKAYWEQFYDKHDHRLHMWKGGHMDTRTGNVTVDDGVTHSEFKPNKDNGTVTITDTKYKPDGTLDNHPSSVTTIDRPSGTVKIEAVDPTTGEKKPDDVITIDQNKNTVDAWNMHSTPTDATMVDEHGNVLTIDQLGDIKATDEDGNPILETKGDEVSYDGGDSWVSDEGVDGYTPEEAKLATDNAIATAISVDSNAAALMASLDITPGEIDALENMLAQAVGSMPKNAAIPQQVVSARSTLAALRARLNQDQAVDSRTSAVAGIQNSTLRDYAREAGNLSADEKAEYALKRAGYDVDKDK